MLTITMKNIVPPTPGPGGWKVEYRRKGTDDDYVVATGSPFHSQPFSFQIPEGTTATVYEGKITNMCSTNSSVVTTWTSPCDCSGSTGAISDDGLRCAIVDEHDATVQTTTCFAPAPNNVYGQYGARIYTAGWTLDDVFVAFGAGGQVHTFAEMVTPLQWKNTTGSTAYGAMNRCCLWGDSDCNGQPDSLALGNNVTLAVEYTNTDETVTTMYLGVGSDNDFIIKVGGSTWIDTTESSLSSDNSYAALLFKIWHIFPVPVRLGTNCFNITTYAGAVIPQALGVMLYNNTPTEIQNATADSQLDIKFNSADLIGTTKRWAIASCGEGYCLDYIPADGGTPDQYKCRQVTYYDCNSKPAPMAVNFITSGNTLPCASNSTGYNEFDMIITGAPPGTIMVMAHLTMGGYFNWGAGNGNNATYAADLNGYPGAHIGGSIAHGTNSPSIPPGPSVEIDITTGNKIHLIISSHVDNAGTGFNGGLVVESVNGNTSVNSIYNFCVGWGTS